MNYNTSYEVDEYTNNEYIDFFYNNYIWIIIIVIAIILITVIGYVADKQNIIKNKKNKKDRNTLKQNKKQDKIFDEEIKDTPINIQEKEKIARILEEIENIKLDDKLINKNIEKKSKIEDIGINDIKEIHQPPKSPNADIESIIKDVPKISDSELNEDMTFSEEIPDKLDRDIDDMYKIKEDEGIIQNDNIDLIKNLNDDESIVDMELPNIDSIETDSTSDDFWRF